MRRAAAAALMTAIAVTAAGCASAPHITAAQAARQRGLAAGRALTVGRSQPPIAGVPHVRLGIIAGPAAATGLAAIHLGYIAARLAPSGTRLDVTAYTTSAGEAAALSAGTIDAAYISPVAAISAWQHTHGRIRIIAGATTDAAGAPASVLAVRASYMAAQPGNVTRLLQAQIQAAMLLATNPAAGIPAARTELRQLLHRRLPRAITAALQEIRATDSPDSAAILTLGRNAATAGQLQPLTSLSGLFDLTPVNALLRTSGLPAAS